MLSARAHAINKIRTLPGIATARLAPLVWLPAFGAAKLRLVCLNSGDPPRCAGGGSLFVWSRGIPEREGRKRSGPELTAEEIAAQCKRVEAEEAERRRAKVKKGDTYLGGA